MIICRWVKTCLFSCEMFASHLGKEDTYIVSDIFSIIVFIAIITVFIMSTIYNQLVKKQFNEQQSYLSAVWMWPLCRPRAPSYLDCVIESLFVFLCRMLLVSCGLCLRSLWGSAGRPWPTACWTCVKWLTSVCGAGLTRCGSSVHCPLQCCPEWRRGTSRWTNSETWAKMRSVGLTPKRFVDLPVLDFILGI